MLAKHNALGRGLIQWLSLHWPDVDTALGEAGPEDTSASATELNRRARLAHASRILARPVASFNDLSLEEAKRLKSAYLFALGDRS